MSDATVQRLFVQRGITTENGRLMSGDFFCAGERRLRVIFCLIACGRSQRVAAILKRRLASLRRCQRLQVAAWRRAEVAAEESNEAGGVLKTYVECRYADRCSPSNLLKCGD